MERGQVCAKPGSITPHTEVQGAGVHPDEGGGRAAHAVFQRVSAAVLLPDDGRDGDGAAAGGCGDGDAGGQREPGDRPDHADRDGEGTALRHPRGRPHRRRRNHCRDPGDGAGDRVQSADELHFGHGLLPGPLAPSARVERAQ